MPNQWRTGDRVTLTLHPTLILRGVVSWERSGFVRVAWDTGDPTDVWGTDLRPEPPDAEWRAA
jgi:hypothetical protein